MQVDKNDRPKIPPKIIRAELLFPPFEDLKPREKIIEIIEEPVKEKVRGVKYVNFLRSEIYAILRNLKLLSFVDEAEEEDEETVKPFKMVSAHTVIPMKRKKKKGQKEMGTYS